jgi:hypothetical protein
MTTDTELEILFSVATTLKSDYVRDESADPWAKSPFAWIKTRPSRQIGKIGEQLVAEWCRQKGFLVSKSGDSECDLTINKHRVEVKFSTLWESGVYTFQQIRDQNYEYALFLGISPFSAHCWFVSKTLLRQHVIGHLPQHAGKSRNRYILAFVSCWYPSRLVIGMRRYINSGL